MKRIFVIGQSAHLNKIVATVTWIALISSMLYMPVVTLSSATYSSSVSTGMHKTEDIFGGGFSPQEVVASLGKTFDVSFSICPTKDAPNTVVRFIIPFALVKLVHGDSAWTGDVKKGETVILSLSFEVQEDVKATVRADVKTGLKYFSSFFLQIATENAAAGAGPCKILPVSEVDLPATNPESTRAISSAKATEKPTVGPDQLRFYGTFYFVNDQGGYSPARYMNVKIMDDDGILPDEEIWSGWTDANGYYDVITNNDDGLGQGGRDPYVQLWAIGQYDWETKNGDGDTYSSQSPVLKEECVGGEEFVVGGVPAANNEAWMAGDACWQEADWVWSHTSPSWEIGYRVVIYWPVGTWDYSGGDSIYLHAGFGGHTTVLHEYGHCVMWNAFGGSWPEGAAFCEHWVGFEDPHLADAWEEGWAEFMECAVENNPNNLQGNWQNIETNDWYNWVDTGDMDGAYIEGEVASILWDIFDPADVLGDDDHMLRPFNDIFTVLLYGDAGTDDNPNSILDFWDDWNSRWPDVTTSIGPLCDVYWNYGIDKDWYAPWGWNFYIDQGDYTNSRWVTLTLWADDWGAGVRWMRFSEDGGLTWTGWYAYSTTFSYYITSSGDGWKWIDVQFGDPWWESPSYADGITLDTTPPTGSVVINSGMDYTNSRWVTLTISATDPLTGVAYMRFADDYPTLTWSDWYPYATTFDFYIDNPGDGSKAIDVQFIDWAGNPTTPGGICDYITLDTTAPTGSIIINSGDPTYAASTSVTLYLSYGDNLGVKEVYYGNAGEYWQGPFSPTDTMPWTLPSGDGSKTVWYMMYDYAGNYYMCSDSITLDTTAPTGSIIINSGDPTYTTSTSVTLYLTYGDSMSGVKEVYYANGDGSWTGPFSPTATKSWTLSLGDGAKLVLYLIHDYAGNYYSTFDYITLDTTSPTGSIIINSGDPTYTTSTSVTLYLTYGDSLSGVKEVYYGNAGEYWQGPYSPTATQAWTLPSGDGTKTVWYMMYDYAGNYYMCNDNIILDTVAPSVTSFTVTPTPFTPNGDGIKDSTTVAATFSETVDWEIQLKDSVGTVLLIWTGTDTSLSIVWDGRVGSTVVADGAYEFVLSGEDLANWSLATETEPVTVVTATLAGDIDYDGDVDYSDFIVLAGAYGSTIGHPGYNSAADIDGDGDVDYSDFVILAGNYGKQWP